MLRPHRFARLSYPSVLRSLSKIREVDTTKTKLNKEHIIGEIIQDDDLFGKLDPEKVKDPSTKEHKIYRLGKNLNIIKQQRLTEADFQKDPIAADIPNKVQNSVLRNLNPWQIFKNVPRFYYHFSSLIAKIWRNWDPSQDYIMRNDNPTPRSFTYQFHKHAYKIPPVIGNYMGYVFSLWGNKYKSKVPNLPNTLAHQNGIFLFQSTYQDGFLLLRFFEYHIVALAALLFLTPHTAVIPFYAACLFLYYVPYAQPTSHTVIRADFLPHTQQILFSKSGFFGMINPHAVNCSDLIRVEHKSFPDLHEDTTDNFDLQLMFRDIATGEYFAFPKYGVWSKEGLENPLMNSLLK